MRPARSPSATGAAGAAVSEGSNEDDSEGSIKGSAGGVIEPGGIVVLLASGVGFTVGNEETRDSS